MTVKAESKKEERYWASHFLFSILLFALFFGIRYTLEESQTVLRTLNLYGLVFSLSYFAMTLSLYINRGNRNRLTRAAFVVGLIEFIILMAVILGNGLSLMWLLLFVFLADGIVMISAFAHERILI